MGGGTPRPRTAARGNPVRSHSQKIFALKKKAASGACWAVPDMHHDVL